MSASLGVFTLVALSRAGADAFGTPRGRARLARGGDAALTPKGGGGARRGMSYLDDLNGPPAPAPAAATTPSAPAAPASSLPLAYEQPATPPEVESYRPRQQRNPIRSGEPVDPPYAATKASRAGTDVMLDLQPLGPPPPPPVPQTFQFGSVPAGAYPPAYERPTTATPKGGYHLRGDVPVDPPYAATKAAQAGAVAMLDLKPLAPPASSTNPAVEEEASREIYRERSLRRYRKSKGGAGTAVDFEHYVEESGSAGKYDNFMRFGLRTTRSEPAPPRRRQSVLPLLRSNDPVDPPYATTKAADAGSDVLLDLEPLGPASAPAVPRPQFGSAPATAAAAAAATGVEMFLDSEPFPYRESSERYGEDRDGKVDFEYFVGETGSVRQYDRRQYHFRDGGGR